MLELPKPWFMSIWSVLITISAMFSRRGVIAVDIALSTL